MAKDFKKFPKLREDLKISKMVNKTNTHFVIKDPIKNTYFRFSEDEFKIIELFDGNRTLNQIIEDYNKNNEFGQLDEQTVEEYWDHLNSIHLLVKSQEEMNVMLVEKVKEMRQMQLLSKKGSLMYKRFPLVDPDVFFDRIINKISFFWTKTFFIFSLSIMIGAVFLILSNWNAFNLGMYELFNFSEMSWGHLFTLWVVVYATIAIHELGHGLTCKYYGGEVHEIGFLLLFFQPCLYANVNDAWLFDKKWKQIMVTIAGGYIEFFVGAIFTYIWFLTNANTFLNVISFQIMTICSVSTVMFNFNPLIKLDGYYLISDFLEAPNLKEESFKYLKYVVKKYIFQMPVEKFYATNREKKIYLIYGIASFIWMTLLLTGLVGMAKGILVDKFHAFGMIITFWIAYKLFSGHVKSSSKFLLSFFVQYRSFFQDKKHKMWIGASLASFIVLFFIPVHYKIKGQCSLVPNKVYVLRSLGNGEVISFYKNDGDLIKNGDDLIQMSNINTYFEREIASLSYDKSILKMRKTLAIDPTKVHESMGEVKSKNLELLKKDKIFKSLKISFNNELVSQSILSCEDQQRIVGKFFKEGEEICKIYDIEKLKTLVEVTEQDVRYLSRGQEVFFKVFSDPSNTYSGKVFSIKPTGKADPKNPTLKIYTAEILIDNQENLRPGMVGQAKIMGNKVSIFKYMITKISSALRLDLFY